MESTLTTPSLPEFNSAAPDTRIYPKKTDTQLAWIDFKEGMKKWRVWVMLAYLDVKLRYRRSILGPFWITLSMAITVYSMGFLYSHLFHSTLQNYFPFLVTGMLAWALVASSIIDLTDAFTASEVLIKQIKLPYSVYVHRIIVRSLIVFFHNIVVMIPLYIIYHQTVKINVYTLMLIPGLMLIYINAFFYGMVLSMLGARYRDILQFIRSLIQVAFFVTPIMWNPNILPEHERHFVKYNPFDAFVELVRAPLIGAAPELFTFLMVAMITIVGIGICFMLFKKYRSRIVYWL